MNGIAIRTVFYTIRTAENEFRVVLKTNERVIWGKVLREFDQWEFLCRCWP